MLLLQWDTKWKIHCTLISLVLPLCDASHKASAVPLVQPQRTWWPKVENSKLQLQWTSEGNVKGLNVFPMSCATFVIWYLIKIYCDSSSVSAIYLLSSNSSCIRTDESYESRKQIISYSAEERVKTSTCQSKLKTHTIMSWT